MARRSPRSARPGARTTAGRSARPAPAARKARKKAGARPAASSAKAAARKAVRPTKPAAKKTAASAKKKATASKATPARKATQAARPRKPAPRPAPDAAPTPRPPAAATPATPAPARAVAPRASRPRTRPAPPPVLDLEPEDDERDDTLVPGAVSSLDMDHQPREVRRTGLDPDAELSGRTSEDAHLVAGDLDADVQAASHVGEETPGGDNPTPDQDVVDLIGRSLGVEYADDQELEGGEEIVKRDRKRWELDPASSEDWKERSKG